MSDDKPLQLKYLTVDEVKALNADPNNPRVHSADQSSSLVNVMNKLEELTDDDTKGRGWNDALTYNTRLKLLQDGHLRQKDIDKLPTTSDGKIPVIFGEWNEDQHKLSIVTRDALAELAVSNVDILRSLVDGLKDDSTSAIVKNILESSGTIYDISDRIRNTKPPSKSIRVDVPASDRDWVVALIEDILTELDMDYKVEVY